MIRLDQPQGSLAWVRARLGLPTASQYHRIITPKTGKLSESSTSYRNELLAEWLLGSPLASEEFDFTARGTQLEAAAYRYYEMQREVDVERVGLLLRDDQRTGCSPDGLVGDKGGLEIKCPSPAVHIGYLLDGGGEKYRAQVQGALWVTEREWWDFLSYHPTLPPALVRCHREDIFIRALAGAVDAFCDRLAAAKAELAARGFEPEPEPDATEPVFWNG